MKKILVLYYSRSGNTEKMAKAIVEGAKKDNLQVDLNFRVEPQELNGFDAIIIGAPTYHQEMPLDFKELFEEASAQGINLKGKIGAAFGSYGWSGEAPKNILEIMENKFEMQVIEPPLLAKYTPNEKMLNECRELGKKIAEKLMSMA
jgi:flavorubredoxin